jgi:violaxanthin de-epoxidase
MPISICVPLRKKATTYLFLVASVIVSIECYIVSHQSSKSTAFIRTHRSQGNLFHSVNKVETKLFGEHGNIQNKNGRQNVAHKQLQEYERSIRTMVGSVLLTLSVLSTSFGGFLATPPPAFAEDSTAIVKCLFQKCPTELGKCILDPKCLANVICINTCKAGDIDCQIGCGDVLDSPAIANFNKCVISDQLCVAQKPDEGLYPVLNRDVTVPKFDTSLFNGRWYISAGQNKLFDIFPCQVHFFTETSPGKFFGKLNWRVTEPDGEFFIRDAIQEFYQDPADPAHLINHDNEYLHYKDDWYIVDYEYDNNKDGVPPFAFVYYRGSNDAWDGYGGVVIYTRDATFPDALKERARAAAAKIGYNFDTDFVITDNSCPSELSAGEKLVLREQFAGRLLLQTEQQIAAAATQYRGNSVNGIKAQKLFFENRQNEATSAFNNLSQQRQDFENEVTGKK